MTEGAERLRLQTQSRRTGRCGLYAIAHMGSGKLGAERGQVWILYLLLTTALVTTTTGESLGCSSPAHDFTDCREMKSIKFRNLLSLMQKSDRAS